MLDAPFSIPFQKYLSAVGGQTSFSLATGRVAPATVEASPIIPLWVGTGYTAGLRHRFAHLIPYGSGSDNTTFDYKIWLLYCGLDPSLLPAKTAWTDGYLALLGSGTATLSTVVGASGSLVAATERYADTLTFNLATASGAGTVASPLGEGETLINAYGSVAPQVYSPAGNLHPARLILPHLCGADALVIECDLTGATGHNFLVNVGR